MSNKKERKVAFIDRDGALIHEPQDTFQVDTVGQLQILPGVVKGLQGLIRYGYRLVMVTNQDGLGSPANPLVNFETVQAELLRRLHVQGIDFHRIFVCPHFPEEKCRCRKPQITLVQDFIMNEGPLDFGKSLMVGDRDTDGEFAKRIGIRFFKMDTNGLFPDIKPY